MTSLVNPSYAEDASSPTDEVNANNPLSMADVTDILENELKSLNEKLEESLKVKSISNKANNNVMEGTIDTMDNMPTKNRTTYASTNYTSMGIGNPMENLPGFDSDDGLEDEDDNDEVEMEQDDRRLTVADDDILRERNKKKAEAMFAEIDFIDDDDDDDDEEEEDSSEESDNLIDLDEDEDDEIVDDDTKRVKVDDNSEGEGKTLKDPDADVASPSKNVLSSKLRGFLNYYADFEALAKAHEAELEDDATSLHGSVSDSESESREGLYEPPQHQPPFDSGPSTMEDDSTDDCESTYAMLYKSFSLRSQEEGLSPKTLISPSGVQPDHGYASETSTDDRMSPIKRPGLLSKEGLKHSLAVLAEDSKYGTEIQSQIQSPVEPESGIEVTPEPKTDPHLMDITKPSTSQKGTLMKPTSLPPGWREVADTHGTYYWHIPSGTTQWSPPADSHELNCVSPPKKPARMVDNKDIENDCDSDKSLKEFQQSTLRYASLNLASGAPERRENRTLSAQNPKGIRFHVRSLGWVEMEDSDLSPGKSSLAVNNCIRQLSYRKTDIRDVAGIWGEGKDMYMVLENEYLKLTDPNDGTVLNSQHVCSIRVWGVGRDNGRERDFAYVARDKVTRRYKCHVFRCDIPAKTIANALHEICAKVMSERQKGNTISMVTQGQMIRQQQQQQLQQMKSISLDSSKETNANTVDFPTPKAEPITVFRANYIGSTTVTHSSNIEVLNDAINQVFDMTPADQWMPVRIEVAVSTITVTSVRTKEVITENRIRFLSFLGIGPDIRQFGYIMCVGKNKFQCHVFCCEHSAGGLAKSIEAACKLRYQKCLDARPKNNFLTADCGDGKTWGCALKSGVQSLFSRFGTYKAKQEPAIAAV